MKWIRFLLLTLIALAAPVIFLAVRPTAHHSPEAPGFVPVDEPALATRFVPEVWSGEFESPTRLLYRMARDERGRVHIVYHFVWPGERNPGPGWGPRLSRWVYTGGLGLQRIMFGKGDIELVVVVVGPDGRLEELLFETAEAYDPRAFGVRHRDVRLRGPAASAPGFALRVMSWNHLFEPLARAGAAPRGSRVTLAPEYFTNELWEEYTMFRQKETFFRRSRAHEPFERKGVR